jgi:DNA-binding transcriptional regulator YhcF (GntR family)
MFDLTVDRSSEVPLGTQLAWKLRTLIASGDLGPGTRLPAVRELAEAAGVNVNTVRSVYARLEEQGLIASEHGRGTFVAPEAPQRAELSRIVADAAAQARRAGVDPRDLAAALFVGPSPEDADAGAVAPPAADAAPAEAEATPAPPAPDASDGAREAALRRALRVEIAELERELARLEGLGALAPAASARPTAGRILGAAELRGIRDDLVARLEVARGERAAALRRAAEAAIPSPARAPARVWRTGGVWTGARPGVVRTASYGA